MTEDARKSRVSIMEQRVSGAGMERRASAVPGGTAAQGATNITGKSTSRLKVRRTSFGFSSVPGIRPVERTSQVGFEFRRPGMVYLPTYQIDPRVKFNNFIVNNIIEKHLDEQFEGHKYNPHDSPALALKLAGDLMRATKSLFNRYRIITVVTVGQKRSQSYNNAVTFLWDYERDSYVDVHRETTTTIIQTNCTVLYIEDEQYQNSIETSENDAFTQTHAATGDFRFFRPPESRVSHF